MSAVQGGYANRHVPGAERESRRRRPPRWRSTCRPSSRSRRCRRSRCPGGPSPPRRRPSPHRSSDEGGDHRGGVEDHLDRHRRGRDRADQFQEFDVSLGPLPDIDQIVFKALQTYSDGEIVRWIDEPAAGTEPEHPAPVLKLAAAGSGQDAHGAEPGRGARAKRTPAAEGASGGGLTRTLAVGALAVAVAGLTIALLAYRGNAGRRTDG